MDDGYTDDTDDWPGFGSGDPDAELDLDELGQQLDADIDAESGDESGDDLGDDPWQIAARRGPRPKAEGVRIIGADEAAAALESGHVARRAPDDAPRFGDAPPPPSGPRPPLRFPGHDPGAAAKPAVANPPAGGSEPDPFDESRFWDDPADQAAEAPRSRRGRRSVRNADLLDEELFGDEPARATRGGERSGSGARASSSSLQHWTEPPSGEVPRILAGEEPADDLNAWSSLSARPRWRDQPTDWETGDFDESILGDEDHRLGALRSEPEGSAPFSFDDEPQPTRGRAPVAFDDDIQPPRNRGREAMSAVRTGRSSSRLGRDADVAPEPRRAPGPAGPSGRGAGPGRPPSGPVGSSASSGDISTRVVTGAIAGGVVLFAAIIGPGALAFLIGVVLVLAVAEFYQALRTRGYHPATLLGLVGTASMVAGVYWRGETAIPLVLAMFMVFSLLWYVTGVVRTKPTMNVAVTMLAFLYVGFLGSFAVLILSILGDDGIGVLLAAILATVANDVGAYFVGRSVGRTPLAPEISPNKTVEGLIGAVVATFAVCLLIVPFIEPWDGGEAFWLAVVVSVAAPLGDLCESMIKRDLGVKDMGNLLPGHGGVLDRIDALLLVIPATYYLLRIL